MGPELPKRKVIVMGDENFVAKHQTELESQGHEVEPVVEVTDAMRRAFLRDPGKSETVKRAIRMGMKQERERQLKSNAKTFIPNAPHGIPHPLYANVPYKRPADMSARQFKKMRKSKFREFRQNARMATAAAQQGI